MKEVAVQSKFIAGVVIIFFFSTLCLSQVHVDSLENVGIGTSSPNGAQMKIQTNNDSIGLFISNTSSGTFRKFGIYNVYTGAGTSGLKSYGIRNECTFSNALSNEFSGISSSLNVSTKPLTQHINGIESVVNAPDTISTGKSVYGIRSAINAQGDFTKYGMYSAVTRGSSHTEPAYGFFSVTNTQGLSDELYGVYAKVNSKDGGGNSYGIYGTVSTIDTVTGYGVYGSVTGTNAANSWAGYFHGRAFCTAGMWTPSDRNLKENIEDFTKGLDIVNNLRPVIFNYRTDLVNGTSDKKQYGLIAQDVEVVVPEVVTEVALQSVNTNSPDGNNESSFTVRKAINYTSLIPILVKAIQEQQAEIETYRTQVDALQSQNNLQNEMIAELKSRMDEEGKSNKN